MKPIFGLPNFSFAPSVRVIVSEFLEKEQVQIRFPRSKRKRIRNKWAKNSANWVVRYKSCCYKLFDGTLVVDPITYEKLMSKVEKWG